MANYTLTFSKPYPNGWVDKPSKTTPVTAKIMNSYDTAIAALEAYLRDNAIDTVSVSVEQFPSDGREWLGTITVGSNQYRIYMPSLRYENSVSDGIKIGTITLGEQSFDVYAPASSAGGSTVSVVPKTLTGTNIAEITVDGTTYQLYAPTSGGGSGSTVTAEATLTEGTQIGKITIDGTETILYAPTASLITVDAELSATSENPVQNKVIAEEFQKYANGTKVVAKATEAETAKTAASATTAQSATTAENATKATQDAQGNVIDTTYAKKTEIPQGAVVDDALSSTSENPVQNKVVKAEFDKVDSNFTDLEMLGWSVPKECPIQNEVNENQFVQKVGRVDLGSLDWVSVDTNTSLYTTSIKDIKTLSNNVFLLGYSVTSYDIETSKMTNKNIKMSGLDKQDFYIKNDSYTNLDFFKQAMQGQYLYYELAKPITKTIDGNEAISQLNSDITGIKDGTTPAAKAVADEDGNNIKSTYAKKTETSETVTEDVNVVLNSDLFDSTYSDITCVRIGKLCVLSFTIRVQNTISSTLDKIVLMSIVGTKYQPKKLGASTSRRQIFQGFAVGNYDENGKQSQSLNNTVRIITDWDSNYTEIITRDKDRLNWSGYVQGQIMWVTD